VASSASAWLAADLGREVATLVPADAAGSGADLVALVDGLATEAAGHCVELHPAPAAATPRRRDGRAVTEHVVDRQLTTAGVWRQEARLAAWARAAAGSGPAETHPDTAETVASAVAGRERLVLVVGPAGAGKTTALGRAAELLSVQGRAAVGLAPSGKAADVLGAETAWPAATVAKLLAEHARPGGPRPPWHLRAGTTVVLDEASMASTDDLDALVGLVQHQRWRLVCVGDRPSCPPWAGAGCSPGGASSGERIAWRRSGASATPGRPGPASSCGGARRPRPGPMAPTTGSGPSIRL